MEQSRLESKSRGCAKTPILTVLNQTSYTSYRNIYRGESSIPEAFPFNIRLISVSGTLFLNFLFRYILFYTRRSASSGDGTAELRSDRQHLTANHAK